MATVVNIKPRDPFAGFGEAFSRAMTQKNQIQGQKDLQAQAQANALEKMQFSIDAQAEAKRAEEAENISLMDAANQESSATYQVIPSLFQEPQELQRQNQVAAEDSRQTDLTRKDARQRLALRGFMEEDGKFVKLSNAKRESSVLLDRARILEMSRKWDAKLKVNEGKQNMTVAIGMALRKNTKIMQMYTDSAGKVDNNAIDNIAYAVATDPDYKSMRKPLLIEGANPLFVSKDYDINKKFEDNWDAGTVSERPKPGFIPFTQRKDLQSMLKTRSSSDWRIKQQGQVRDAVLQIVKDEDKANLIMSDPVLSAMVGGYSRGLTPENLRRDASSIFSSGSDGQLDMDRLGAQDKIFLEKFYGKTMNQIYEGIATVAGNGQLEGDALTSAPNFLTAQQAVKLQIAKSFQSLGASAIDPTTYGKRAVELFKEIDKTNLFTDQVLKSLAVTPTVRNNVMHKQQREEYPLGGGPDIPVGTNIRDLTSPPGEMVAKMIKTGIATNETMHAYANDQLADTDEGRRIVDALTNLEQTYRDEGRVNYANLISSIYLNPQVLEGFGITAMTTQPVRR